MPRGRSLPDLVGTTREIRGEGVLYRFTNGLAIRCERFDKSDPRRILPLGSPQGSLMNHMLSFPDVVRGKRVFEPFAGSGAIGFMALKVGAEHVDFLDINPRACEFQRANGELNHLPPDRFRAIEGDIANFVAHRRYDLILANPPFVPTPDGIEGTITSNGGPEGNRFVELLLRRMDDLLEPSGEAVVYVFQLVRGQEPVLVERIASLLDHRPVELTPSQLRPMGFDTYYRAYCRQFPSARQAIARWRSALFSKYGEDLRLCHYVVRVGARGARATTCVLRDDFAEKFGEAFRVPSEDEAELALARVLENFVPTSDSASSDPASEA